MNALSVLLSAGSVRKIMELIDGTEKSLQDGHTIKRTLYKADKDFAPNLKFSGQILLKVISIKRTLP